jgi:hypothetical protein
MDMQEALMEENEDLIDKVGLLKIKEIDDWFWVIFLFWRYSFIG